QGMLSSEFDGAGNHLLVRLRPLPALPPAPSRTMPGICLSRRRPFFAVIRDEYLGQLQGRQQPAFATAAAITRGLALGQRAKEERGVNLARGVLVWVSVTSGRLSSDDLHWQGWWNERE